MNAIVLQPRTIQTTNFSPRLQQAVRLLQLSSQDYAQALQEAADGNPFLEFEQSPPVDMAPAVPEWGVAAAEDRAAHVGPLRNGRMSHDESDDALQRIPETASLRQHLHAQLGVLRLGTDERLLAAAVVESLDDDGYLRIDLAEIAATVVGNGQAQDDEVLTALHTALRRVQSLDPCGVAARSLSECLLLQAGSIGDERVRVLVSRMAAHHLDLLASRNWRRLAEVLEAPVEQVKEAAECLRKLNARPGWQFDGAVATFVVPDVIVRKRQGCWVAVLNEAIVPRVRLHLAYARMLEQQTQGRNPELMGYLDKARWTVQNAAQRVSTIRDVAQAIVTKQKLFLDYGPLAMKPLGLREIANEVGVHPSTVSRTVHHKYMATPAGVFELKHFFSRGLAHGSGRASAPTAVKQLLRELIAAEPGGTPMSDAQLAAQLLQHGFRIARRTVSKYRQAMHIDPVDRRGIV